jgi:uncharacterized protein (TIGR03118 family)
LKGFTVQRSRRIGAHARSLGTVALALTLSVPLVATPVAADSSQLARQRGYHQATLVTNLTTASPAIQDPNLRNPWGIAFGYAPNATPLWVANQGTSTSTLYSGATDTTPGITKVGLTVTTPPSPTGVVFNTDTTAFKLPDGRSSRFIFATLGGQIAGWAAPPPPTSTTTMVTKAGAEFTGLAIANTARGSMLYAADAASRKVRVYDSTFKPAGTIIDRHMVKGLKPYNVAVIGKKLLVSYAPPEGGRARVDGAIDVFTLNGHLKRRLIVGGKLDGPWGMVMAPQSWGRFGGALLVGNEEGGAIHAYNRHTGRLLGTVRGANGKALRNDGLWGMQFGNGVIGTANTLIVAAGIDHYADGIVAGITPNPKSQGGGYSQRKV